MRKTGNLPSDIMSRSTGSKQRARLTGGPGLGREVANYGHHKLKFLLRRAGPGWRSAIYPAKVKPIVRVKATVLRDRSEQLTRGPFSKAVSKT